MAEIDIERKKTPAWFPWLLATLLLLAVVGTAWYLTGPGGGRLTTDTDSVGTFPIDVPARTEPSRPATPAPEPAGTPAAPSTGTPSTPGSTPAPTPPGTRP